MPYNNAYNQGIAAKLQNLYKNHIQHENATNDNVRQNDVMDPLEGMALRHEEVHGGSGTAAATLHDLGYEQMNGATGTDAEPKPKRKYMRKAMRVAVPSAMAEEEPSATAGGVSAGGVSAGGVSGAGASGGSFGDAVRGTVGVLGHATGLNRILPTDYIAQKLTGGETGGTLNNFEAARELIKQLGGSAPEVVGCGASAGAKKRVRKPKEKTGGDFGSTVRDIADTVGSVGKAVMPFAPLLLGLGEPKEELKEDSKEEGGAKKRNTNARAEVVRQIMKEKGLNLIDASKHVKEHGLYKKGGALLSLASLGDVKGNQGPVMFESGGVPNTKLPEESKYKAGSKPRKPRAKKLAAA